MHKFLIIFCLTFSAICAPKEYLFCLGQEEKVIHTKRLNPARKFLNEKVISLVLQLTKSVTLNRNYLDKICQSKTPSLEILGLILRKKNIFKISVSKLDKNQYFLAKGSIEEINNESVFLFIDYISMLKSLNSDPKCFQKFFPKVNKALNNAVKTMEETGPNGILKDMGDIRDIFKKLESYPMGLKEC